MRTYSCKCCYKPIKDPVISLHLTRYEIEDPEMYICNDCYRSFQQWIKPTGKYPTDGVSNLVQ